MNAPAETAAPGAEFDTLAAVRTLEAAGIERQHAEAHAETLRASRADLDDLERRLMAHIRAEYWRLFAAILAGNLGIGAIFLAAAKFLWP